MLYFFPSHLCFFLLFISISLSLVIPLKAKFQCDFKCQLIFIPFQYISIQYNESNNNNYSLIWFIQNPNAHFVISLIHLFSKVNSLHLIHSFVLKVHYTVCWKFSYFQCYNSSVILVIYYLNNLINPLNWYELWIPWNL